MTKNELKISVIMTTYNRKDYLKRAVDSVLAQTLNDFEIIIVNNGSTDGSDAVCEEFEKKDDRIKHIKLKENVGPSLGRKTGLDAANSNYITFVDDDDYCEPEMFGFLWKLVDEHSADISICGSWFDFGDRHEPKYIYEELLILNKIQGLEELLKRKRYNVAPATKLYRKSLFDGVCFKENVMVDDIHFIYKVFSNADIVVAQGKPLYNFTKHLSNVTSFNQTNKLTPQLLNEYLLAFRERTEYLIDKVPGISSRVKYSELSYMISMCDRIKKYNGSECLPVYNFMVSTLQKKFYEFINSPFITKREIALLKEHIFINTTNN